MAKKFIKIHKNPEIEKIVRLIHDNNPSGLITTMNLNNVRLKKGNDLQRTLMFVFETNPKKFIKILKETPHDPYVKNYTTDPEFKEQLRYSLNII